MGISNNTNETNNESVKKQTGKQVSTKMEGGCKGSASKKHEKAKYENQIKTRLDTAVQNHTVRTGRSQDVVPLSRDCERLRKHLREFIDASRAHQKTMIKLESERMNVRPRMRFI